MGKRLVYNGKAFTFIDVPDPVAPTIGQAPRAPQKAAYGHRGMPYRLRNLRPISAKGNGYKPGPLLDLGTDQCRYTIAGKTMFGAKCGSHPSWCDEHAQICSRGKIAFDSVRMQSLGGRK